jgi:hypothetical protein
MRISKRFEKALLAMGVPERDAEELIEWIIKEL